MGDTKDLFPENPPVPRNGRPVKWILATNQLNLMFMLAAGLILPPEGFGKKYYRDCLSEFPGWVPLFADAVPKSPLERATSEGTPLRPCLASVDLSALKGRVKAVTHDGASRDLNFPEELDGREAALLLPAPLPAHWVESLVFRSKDDRTDCELWAGDYANVPLNDFKREVNASAFAQTGDGVWPPAGLDLPNRDDALDGVRAAGGMMAMLCQFANRGDVGVSACRLAFDRDEAMASSITDPMIKAMSAWLDSGVPPRSGETSARLFWGVIDRVAHCRFSENAEDPRDAVLNFLGTAQEFMEEKERTFLTRLSNDLRALAGFVEHTVSDLFQRHPKPFSRALILFFLRDRCAELIEFRHPLLSETDYIAAALLFGARDGWLGLPLTVRDHPNMSSAVSHRMATMAHGIAKTGLDLGSTPTRYIPLRELFAPSAKGWSKQQQQAALCMARESKWDCIHTKISLGKGDYRLRIDGGGAHLLLPGEVKAVVTEVDRETFFARLADAFLPPKLDRKAREMLGN